MKKQSNSPQPAPPRHKWDDEGCCIHCGYDGAEADYYSKRGYAHEYPTLKGPCPKAPVAN